METMKRVSGTIPLRSGHGVALLLATVSLACSCRGSGGLKAGPAPSQTVPTFASKIRIVPGLAEPLVTTKATTDAEDRDLAEATEGRDGALPPLIVFLATHPHSGWNAAVHTNLGLAYYQQGFFTKAIRSFEAAWKEGRDARDFRAKALVDRAFGELAKMYARVGRLPELDNLLAQTGERSIQGGASELLTGAKEGAWTMRHNPGISFLCGPKALRNLLEALGAKPAALAVADAARSGERNRPTDDVVTAARLRVTQVA